MTDPKSPDAEPVANPPADDTPAAPKRRRRRAAAPDASPAAEADSSAGTAQPQRADFADAADPGQTHADAAPGADAAQGAAQPASEGGAEQAGPDGRRKRHRNRRRNRRGGGAGEGQDLDGPVAVEMPKALPPGDANEWFAAVLSGEYDQEEPPAEAASLADPATTERLLAADAPLAEPALAAEPEVASAEPSGDAADEAADPHSPSDGIDGASPSAADGRRVLQPEPDAPKLQKVLAQAGVGSRRDLESIIASGRVQVNGQPAHVGQRIRQGDRVTVDGKPVRLRIQPLPARVIAYHKPVGEVVTHDDPQARPTVFRRLPRLQQGKWQSVGRLDINTEGLLLFTNSGDLANRLMHPRFGVEREYAVRVLGTLEDEERQRLLDGVEIEGQAAAFRSITDGGGEGVNRWYRVVISEGRNREVRRLFESVGKAVSRLIRIRYGVVVLPRGLRRGAWVDLSQDDVNALRDVTGMPERPPRAAREGRDGGKGSGRQGGRQGGRNAERGQERGQERGANRRGPRDGAPDPSRDLPREAQPNAGGPLDDDRKGRRGRRGRGGKKEFSQNFGPDGRPLKQSDLRVADFDDGMDVDGPVGPIPNPLQQTFDKRAFQQSRRPTRDYGEDGPIPNPLQQTYDKRAVTADRRPKREYGEDGPIPNPLQQTYDKRFASGNKPTGKPSGGKPGRGAGQRKAGGAGGQPDPMRTAVGYIGGDALMNKLRGGSGGGKGGRGRGGKGR